MMSKNEKGFAVGILTGPTATGKSGWAIELACRIGNIELINADSLLVYRGMNIGTAKPTPEELSQVPHHLIDIRNPDEPFTSGEFTRAAQSTLDDIHRRGKRALIVGGTGFYLKSLLFGLWEAPAANAQVRERLDRETDETLFRNLEQKDPISSQRIGPADRYRLIRALEIIELTGKTPTELQSKLEKTPDPKFKLWILDRPTSELQDRIEKRTQQMLDQGLIEEFRTLHQKYPASRALQSIGYKQVHDYLENRPPSGRKLKPGLLGLKGEIELATRQLVKSQRTWFKNQVQHIPNSQCFQLDENKSQLEEAFNSVYL